jgi:hypothetical protein
MNYNNKSISFNKEFQGFDRLVFILMLNLLMISFLFISNDISAQNLVKDYHYRDRNSNLKEKEFSLIQKPTKKVYFVPGGKIGMFFLQGYYDNNQMISLEAFGHYKTDAFFAEIGIPFRFKTSPWFGDLGLDINVFYPFLGKDNKSELDPYIGGGLGLHFIGKDKDEPDKTTVAMRGGLGLNLVIGTIIFRNYDFNVVAELKYFIYLREFDNEKYHGIALNIGATFPK